MINGLDQNPSTCRAVILSGKGDDLKVLLLRRKFPPYDGSLTLPGGFIKSSESSEESIVRKVKKETGLDLSHSFSSYQLRTRKNNLDPRGDYLCQGYLFLADAEFNSEVLEFSGEERPEWYYLDEVEQLGFNHGAILCEALGLLWSKLSANGPEALNISLPKDYSDHNINWASPVVFFGGSFNPWHDGHQACLDLCPNKNIVIVPDTNPWKLSDPKKGKCYWSEYRQMAEKFSKQGYAVYPGYFGIEEGNPTINWLPHAHCNQKEFLMGFDSFHSFPGWKNVDQLMKFICKLYVVPRDVSKEDFGDINRQVEELRDRLDICVLGEHSFMGVSSSDIRKDNQ